MSEQEQHDVSQVAPSNDSPSSTPEESKEGAGTQAPTEQELPIEQVRQLKIRIEELEKELAQERDKATEYMNLAMRSQADASNMRKRLQQDLARAMQDMLRSVVYEQLAVLDSFDRAFNSLPPEFRHFTWVEGMSMIQSQLYSILYRAGVTPVEALGKQFNPIEHEAVAFEETGDRPEDTVTAELQRGYKLQDQVLRPALVKIARAPQAAAAATGNENEKTES
jgi:molecular chaperone GrpE